MVGTGDCTHPEWLTELRAKLTPVADGVYGLKEGLALPLQALRSSLGARLAGALRDHRRSERHLQQGRPGPQSAPALVLSGLAAAERLSQRLGQLGNVVADGRPILGLDAKYRPGTDPGDSTPRPW